MNAYMVCAKSGLPLLKYVSEESRKGWDELFGEGENKFWQCTAQYIVLTCGLLQYDNFPFSLSWQGLRVSVLPAQHVDHALYHVHLQSENKHHSSHRELVFSPFLVCKLIDRSLVSMIGGDFLNFLNDASNLTNQRVNDSSFNNSVGDDELAWWWEFLQGNKAITKHLQTLEDNHVKKLISPDRQAVHSILTPYIQLMHRIVFDELRIDKVADRVFSSFYMNDSNSHHTECLFTVTHHHLQHTTHKYIVDDSLVQSYIKAATTSQESVVVIADASCVALALKISNSATSLFICVYPFGNTENEQNGSPRTGLLHSLISDEEAISSIERHSPGKEAYLNVSLQYPLERLVHANLRNLLQEAIVICRGVLDE